MNNATIFAAVKYDTATALSIVLPDLTLESLTDRGNNQVGVIVSTVLTPSQISQEGASIDAKFATVIQADANSTWLIETKKLLATQPEALFNTSSMNAQLISAASASPAVGTTPSPTTAVNGFCQSDDQLKLCIIIGSSVFGGLLGLIVGIILYRSKKKKKTVSLSAFLNTTEGSPSASPQRASSFNDRLTTADSSQAPSSSSPRRGRGTTQVMEINRSVYGSAGGGDGSSMAHQFATTDADGNRQLAFVVNPDADLNMYFNDLGVDGGEEMLDMSALEEYVEEEDDDDDYNLPPHNTNGGQADDDLDGYLEEPVLDSKQRTVLDLL